MKAFLDTNILVYAQQEGTKGDRARELVAQGGVISVQVLNEMANVLLRKFGRGWSEVEQVLEDAGHALGEALPLTAATHRAAVILARGHGIGIYDALILASALEAGCDVLYSEDLQNGRMFSRLIIRNPFAGAAGR